MNNALILGASSDIAQAIAAKLSQEGYSITLAGRSLDKLEPIKSDLELKYGIQAYTVLFDALSFETHSVFFESLPVRPTLCVCVFGWLGEQEKDQDDWDSCKKTIDSNYTGAVSILNIVANDLKERGSGMIVGISSVAGERGRQSNYIYGSAKAGFTAYLSGLRNRLAKSSVHVLTVKPGFVSTRMTEHLDLPKKLTALPEQVANNVFNAIRKKRNVIYVLPVWHLIMFIIRMIPERIFKRLNL